MKRVLSLLLLVPFLTVQAWALVGGPYDSLSGRSLAAFAGTYGIVLNGTQDRSETGVMTMVVPSAGMASGRLLIFSKGLMYLGSAQGTVDPRTKDVTLMSQMSHYVARAVSDGIQSQSGVVVDSILSGTMAMRMELDYFSGLIQLAGRASYYAFDPLLSTVVLNTTTETGAKNQLTNQNSNTTKLDNENAQSATVSTTTGGNTTNTSSNSGQGTTGATTNTSGQVVTSVTEANASKGSTATTSANAGTDSASGTTATASQDSTTSNNTVNSLSQASSSSTSATVANPDGTVTATSDTTAATKNVSNNASDGTSASSSQTQTSGTTASSTKTETANNSAVSTQTDSTNKTASSTQTTGTTSTQASNTTQVKSSGDTTSTTTAADKSTGGTTTNGATVVAGTTQTTTQTKVTTTYDPSKVRQTVGNAGDAPYMNLNLSGVRQDTSVATVSPFTPPSEATLFQIDVAAPATTGGGGNGAGGGAVPVRAGN